MPTAKVHLNRINQRAHSIAELMIPYTTDPKALKVLRQITIQFDAFEKWKIKLNDGEARLVNTNSMTVALLEEVYQLLPNSEWEKDIHKRVAAQLHITNTLAQKCIYELLRQNRWHTDTPS